MSLALNAGNMTWKHWSPRKRYVRSKTTGAIEATAYDRLLIGLRPAGRPWLESHYTGDALVTVFILGIQNVVLCHRAGDSVVYVNRKAGAQAQEYVRYYIDRLQVEKGITATTELVDDLPTQTITRASAGGIDSLDKAIAAACSRSVDDLGI